VSSAELLFTVPSRFRGPPESANGGYFAGRVAALLGRDLRVHLRRAPPLGAALRVERRADGGFEVRDADTLIAEATAETLQLSVPVAVPYMAALAATRHFAGFAHHPFPGCFVCGTERARGDGLRIFASTLPGFARDVDRRVAAAWTPEPALAAADGKVHPEYLWAALDCPGYFAVAQPVGQVRLLAEFAVRIDRRVHADEPCVILGWTIRREGRSALAGTALFAHDGTLCACAEGRWVEPRAPGPAA
jgi:hypothetical protein